MAGERARELARHAGVPAADAERGWGRIVNVSTELASNARGQGGDIYSVTKVAQNAMTRALAEDLAGTGILVNAISPGWCRSDMGGGRAAFRGAGRREHRVGASRFPTTVPPEASSRTARRSLVTRRGPAQRSTSPTTKKIDPMIEMRSGNSVPGSMAGITLTLENDAVRIFSR